MIPHERELVERFKDQPFAIIGIHPSDASRLKAAIKKFNVIWRNIPDGPDRGQIGARWNLWSWPTIYVIDAEGIIRYRDIRGSDLDKAIETLLAEAQAGKIKD